MKSRQIEFKTRPISGQFGVEIDDIELNEKNIDDLYPSIRLAFENHSLLLFRNQNLSPQSHLKLAGLFGPIEDRYGDERTQDETFEIPQVSNVRPDGSLTDEMDLHTLNLKANQLWHTDSTFLPIPALCNIIVAKVVPRSGGGTEFTSTRSAWRDMPDTLRNRIFDKAIWHKYSHSRARISKELSALPMFNKWPDQLWRAIWTNPINGEQALYMASHAYRVEGLSIAQSQELIEELIDFCTQSRYIYIHQWQVGDLLIWDERATMHRGQAWPYDEPRVLSSVCSSVTDADGLPAMRVSYHPIIDTS